MRLSLLTVIVDLTISSDYILSFSDKPLMQEFKKLMQMRPTEVQLNNHSARKGAEYGELQIEEILMLLLGVSKPFWILLSRS